MNTLEWTEKGNRKSPIKGREAAQKTGEKQSIVENGYTRVANEILEAIARTDLNGAEYAVIMVVWRYTYGFSRNSHPLSASFIAEKTCFALITVKKALRSLLSRKILVCENGDQRGVAQILAFNKNYSEWDTGIREYTGILSDTGVQKDTGVVSNSIPELVYDSIPSKRNKKEKNKETLFHAPDGSRACESGQEPQGDSQIGNTSDEDSECNNGQAAEPKQAKQTQLEKDRSNFEKIWKAYPKKSGKARSFEYYRGFVGKGRLLNGIRYRLTPQQIYLAVRAYVTEKEEAGTELKYFQDGSTFFNKTILDYLPGEEESDAV